MNSINRYSLLLLLFLSPMIFGLNKVHPDLENISADSIKVWVFFADKDTESKSIGRSAREVLSERALERRRKSGIPLTIKDVPVNPDYIRQVESLGARTIIESRWLNAASFMMQTAAIKNVSELPFVVKIQPVRVFQRPPEPLKRGVPEEEPPDSFYGYSIEEIEMLRAQYLHGLGYYGQGVVVGMLDSGFRLIHRAFDSLGLIDAYDFVHMDTTVDYDSLGGDTDLTGYIHGTQTLSCLAAYRPGEIIGIAYQCSVLLAKTEDVSAEYVTEEDIWVAGIQWLEAMGADIITSSLGYSVFDSDTPYAFDSLNGDVAVTTVAADIAAGFGICVVNSAGNERTDAYWPHIIAPADGDSVLAAGAVYNDHFVTGFSSPGPTADGRIKPDCVALGSGVTVVNTSDTIGVNSSVSGTSFSCPLIAGLCALVKSARPELFGYDLALAIRSSGDRYRAYDPSYYADSADNDYGWGIPVSVVAAGFHTGLYGRIIDSETGERLTGKAVTLDYGDTVQVVYSDQHGIFVDPFADDGDIAVLKVAGYQWAHNLVVDGSGYAVMLNRVEPLYPNPATSFLDAAAFSEDKMRFSVYSPDGTLVFDDVWTPGESAVYRWNLKNDSGKTVANGLYIVRLATDDEEIIRKIAIVR